MMVKHIKIYEHSLGGNANDTKWGWSKCEYSEGLCFQSDNCEMKLKYRYSIPYIKKLIKLINIHNDRMNIDE